MREGALRGEGAPSGPSPRAAGSLGPVCGPGGRGTGPRRGSRHLGPWTRRLMERQRQSERNSAVNGRRDTEWWPRAGVREKPRPVGADTPGLVQDRGVR